MNNHTSNDISQHTIASLHEPSENINLELECLTNYCRTDLDTHSNMLVFGRYFNAVNSADRTAEFQKFSMN